MTSLGTHRPYLLKNGQLYKGRGKPLPAWLFQQKIACYATSPSSTFTLSRVNNAWFSQQVKTLLHVQQQNCLHNRIKLTKGFSSSSLTGSFLTSALTSFTGDFEGDLSFLGDSPELLVGEPGSVFTLGGLEELEDFFSSLLWELDLLLLDSLSFFPEELLLPSFSLLDWRERIHFFTKMSKTKRKKKKNIKNFILDETQEVKKMFVCF